MNTSSSSSSFSTLFQNRVNNDGLGGFLVVRKNTPALMRFLYISPLLTPPPPRPPPPQLSPLPPAVADARMQPQFLLW